MEGIEHPHPEGPSAATGSPEDRTPVERQALAAWFNMDFRALTEVLRDARSAAQTQEVAPCFALLSETIREEPSLVRYEHLYGTFSFLDDLESCFACTGAAIAAIWASGQDFRRYGLWLSRADFLLARSRDVSPLAVASLLGYKALAELTGWQVVELDAIPFTLQQHWAEQAGSASLRLVHASIAAYCSFWAGDLTYSELLLTDSEPLAELPSTPVVPRLLYKSCYGLCRIVNGDFAAGEAALEEVVCHPALRLLPASISLHLYLQYLHGLCLSGDLARVQEMARLIRRKTIPACSYYHLACLHFCLAVASLRLGSPHKALLHSRTAEDHGRQSSSSLLQSISALIRGQALADLREDGQALDHLRRWIPIWQKRGFGLFAATGFLESASILLRQGKRKEAADRFAAAIDCLPRGEPLVPLYRDAYFFRRLRSLFEASSRSYRPQVMDTRRPIITIQTLGGFVLAISGQAVYDRAWRGRRSKQLLKAIIALGGTKVSLEKLSYLLWPDSDGDRAMNSLKTALSRLRKVVAGKDPQEPGWLVVKYRRVSLVRSLCLVDALEFEQAMQDASQEVNSCILADTLRLYRDDFLPDDEDPWIIACRERLRDLFVSGVLRLATLKDRPDGELRVFLEQAIRLDPLNETVHGCLMQHFLAEGYPVQALKVFQRLEKTMYRSAGISPGPCLQDLVDKARNLAQ